MVSTDFLKVILRAFDHYPQHTGTPAGLTICNSNNVAATPGQNGWLMDMNKWIGKLGFGSTAGPEPDASVARLERLIGVALPQDYRTFLLEIGGGELRDTVAPCTIPTPFGKHNLTCFHSVDEVIGLLDSNVTPRNMVCIAYGHFGMTTCLSVAGLDHGQVFALDTEMRFFWDNEKLRRFPHLDPSVREFFRLRDADGLPPRPWGYENCYHIANSFAEFLGKLSRAQE